jgi:hypothetical protein
MNYKRGLAIVIVAIIMLLVAWFTCGCHDGCDYLSTRCKDNQVQLCNADEDWELVDNCNILEPYDGEICCWDEYTYGHLCKLPEDCDEEGAE